MSCKEWTILEKLLLSQAVYKYGEQSWLQVSSVLKQNALIQHRQSDFFDDKVMYLPTHKINFTKILCRIALYNIMV